MSSVTTLSTESHVGSWQGLTIKEILEKVDLSNIIMEDDEKQNKLSKATTITIPASGEINPESAYLGPKLWSRSVPMPLTGDNDDFAVMNIDDFLSENGFEEGKLLLKNFFLPII